MVATGETSDPADPTGQPRTKDQIKADLLVERVTGQAAAAAVPAEVHLVMTDQALFGDGDTPGWLTGHGPIPAATAKHWLADPEADIYLRRVFTRPNDGHLLGMDSQARGFPPGLRKMITLRDDRCRTPYCDALIREMDHIHPARHGGPTSWTNSSGLCAGCNQTKENTGWTHHGDPEHLTITTPTGHDYTTHTPPLLGAKPPDTEPVTDHDDEPPDIDPRPDVSNCRRKFGTIEYTIRIAA